MIHDNGEHGYAKSAKHYTGKFDFDYINFIAPEAHPDRILQDKIHTVSVFDVDIYSEYHSINYYLYPI